MSKKSPAHLLARLHAQMQRPNQGPVMGPYWIVMNMSPHKKLYYTPPSFPFRHPTQESAVAEAGRLAKKHAGMRFGVFCHTGITAKVEAAPTTIVAEPELQAA